MRKNISLRFSVVMGIFTLILILADSRPAFTQNRGMDISGMVTVTQMKGTEQNTTVIKVDEEKILDTLNKQPGIENLSYAVERQYTQASIEFSHKILTALISRKISMILSTNMGKTVFEPDRIDFGVLVKQGFDPQEVTIRIATGAAPAEQSLAVQRFIQGHGMTGVLEPTEFRVEAQAGNRIVELQPNGDFVIHRFTLPREVNSKQTVGAVLNSTGELIPVPTRFLKENGQNIALVKSRVFGTFTVVENTINFSDASTHWAKDDINILASKMIVNGVGEGLFAPENQVTRAQIAAMLERSLDLVETSNPVMFSDVKKGTWYYANIASIVESGIMRGYPGRVFRPDNMVSRQEVAVLASQVLAFSGEKVSVDSSEIELILSRFKDQTQISPWARESVAAAVKSGILKGTDNFMLNPMGSCTRAEFTVMLRRVLVNAELVSPSVILASPVDNFYTNKDSLSVRGKAKPGNTVSVNGKKVTTAGDGSFDSSIQLFLGINTIGLTDEDLLGNTEKLVCQVVYDNRPPILKITSPKDKDVVTGLQVTVEGYTDEVCSVKINDTEAEVDSDGNFTARVDLELGRNVLSITATDRAGNETYAKRIVYGSPNTISGFTVSPDPIRLGSQVNIRYLLEQDAYVTLVVYRENGDMVKTIQDKTFTTSGNRNGYWNGMDNSGNLVPDGKYRFVGIARDSDGDELARTEKTVSAARVPQIISEIRDLPVFTPSEKEGITLPYSIKSDSVVTIKILKGRTEIKTLVENLTVRSGTHSIIWDAKDDTGNFYGDGEYSCVINAFSAEVENFKAKAEFGFIIERESPKITNFIANPNLIKINISNLNIRYQLSENARVNLRVYDKAGQVVAVLLKDTEQYGGSRNILWNGVNGAGKLVPEGDYKIMINAVDAFQKESGTQAVSVTVGYEPGITEVRINPSPFYATGSNSATISFFLATEAILTVEIKVQWVTVKTLIVESREKPGLKTIRWDGSDNSGYLVGAGRYDIQITATSPTVPSFRTKFNGSFDVKEANSQN